MKKKSRPRFKESAEEMAAMLGENVANIALMGKTGGAGKGKKKKSPAKQKEIKGTSVFGKSAKKVAKTIVESAIAPGVGVGRLAKKLWKKHGPVINPSTENPGGIGKSSTNKMRPKESLNVSRKGRLIKKDLKPKKRGAKVGHAEYKKKMMKKEVKNKK